MIVFSDLHLDASSKDIVFDEVLPGIKQACLDNEDNNIAFLGDFWHIRYKVDVSLFNKARDILRDWSASGFTVRLLPGNHDQVDYEGRNALEAYGDIPNVKVYTNSTMDEYGLWIPYRKNNREITESLELCDPSVGPLILWMHHGVQGAMMNDAYANKEGLVPAAIHFDKVFAGHYHKRQVIDKVTYIGSPWQVTAAEAGQSKGYGIWDGREMKLVTTHWGTRYHNLGLGDSKLDLSEFTEKDCLRITTPEGYDIAKLGEQLNERGIRAVITPRVSELESRLDVSSSAPIVEYAKAYVNLAHGYLDADNLMSIFTEIQNAI